MNSTGTIREFSQIGGTVHGNYVLYEDGVITRLTFNSVSTKYYHSLVLKLRQVGAFTSEWRHKRSSQIVTIVNCYIELCVTLWPVYLKKDVMSVFQLNLLNHPRSEGGFIFNPSEQFILSGQQIWEYSTPLFLKRGLSKSRSPRLWSICL